MASNDDRQGISIDARFAAAIGVLCVILTIVGEKLISNDGDNSSSPEVTTTVFVTPESQPTDDSSAPTPTSTESTSTDPPANPEPTSAYLSDMEPVNSSDYLLESKMVNGRVYSHSVAIDDLGTCGSGQPRKVEFQLDRKWRTFDAWVGLDNNAMSGARYQIEVFNSDTGALLKSDIVKPNMVRHWQVNIRGIARLKLSENYIDGVEGYCRPAIVVWGNAQVRK